jgi:hypothetical protein
MTTPSDNTLLRDRLVAAMRPTLTLTVARMYADLVLDEVLAYGAECAARAMEKQADLITEIIEAAQDCMEILGRKP